MTLNEERSWSMREAVATQEVAAAASSAMEEADKGGRRNRKQRVVGRDGCGVGNGRAGKDVGDGLVGDE
ncbi:hypothetical protein DVH24_026951 [Malus domestica]|uniref:Uncharacterized protein n=1 Tax=Malus domestica TaxID=3750 RepID=A0A498IQ13_MALDO|nr:hypothetical protein DVH24_026951 [Malus domestica]